MKSLFKACLVLKHAFYMLTGSAYWQVSFIEFNSHKDYKKDYNQLNSLALKVKLNFVRNNYQKQSTKLYFRFFWQFFSFIVYLSLLYKSSCTFYKIISKLIKFNDNLFFLEHQILRLPTWPLVLCNQTNPTKLPRLLMFWSH